MRDSGSLARIMADASVVLGGGVLFITVALFIRNAPFGGKSIEVLVVSILAGLASLGVVIGLAAILLGMRRRQGSARRRGAIGLVLGVAGLALALWAVLGIALS